MHPNACAFEKAGTCIAGHRCYFLHAKAAAPAAKAKTAEAKAKAKATAAKKAAKAGKAMVNMDDEDEIDQYASLVFRDGAGNGSKG